MSEMIGIEASRNFVDVNSNFLDAGIFIDVFIDLKLVFTNMRLNWLIFSQILRSVTNIVFNCCETISLFDISQDSNDHCVLFYDVDILPEVIVEGQSINLLGSKFSILRFNHS